MAKQQRQRRRLSTCQHVLDELGGIAKVAELTGRTKRAVYNWRSRGVFPASAYRLMSYRLERRGIDAPARLWGLHDRLMAA